MEVFRSEDPRDRLEKATRDELVAFAHARGQIDISEAMPAIMIRKLLRDRNLTDISIPERPLGTFISREMYGLLEGPSSQDRPQVNADEALIAEWKASAETHNESDPDKMSMGEIRKELKRRGIKMARTDNLETLKAKLCGQNAA